MQVFLNLLNKEWIQFRIFVIGALITCFLFNIGGTAFINRVDSNINFHETLFILSLCGLMFLGIAASYQFVRSLTVDVRKKELWLHNPASMYMLIGTKIVFTMLWYGLSVVVYSMTFHFLKPFMTDTGGILFLQILIVIASVSMLALTAVFLLYCFVFFCLLKQYIKGFAWVVTIIFGFAILQVMTFLKTIFIIPWGVVKLDLLKTYMPTVNSSFWEVSSFDVYVVDELLNTGLLILAFVFVCKWLEKVVTR